MLSKNLIAAATLVLVSGSSVSEPPSSPSSSAPTQEAPAPTASEFERLLPTPQWVMENLSDLGIEESNAWPIRRRLNQTRREYADLRGRLRDLRVDLRGSLASEPLDRARVEGLFDSILELENEIKRTQLRVRLDFMTHITGAQRARVRSLARNAPVQRRVLRRRIEEIRTLGRRLKHTGTDARELHQRLPRVERLIRSGRLREALIESSALRDSLREALGLPATETTSKD